MKFGHMLQFAGYGVLALVVLGVRNANLAPPEPEPIAMSAAIASAQSTETYSDQQVEAGQNLLSNLVLTRATYLLEIARTKENATQWIENHRGGVLGQLRAADTQRGGIWTGNAEDNAYADLVVESLAVELARSWMATKEAKPLANHTFADYLSNARLAGGSGGYDPAAMQIYLAAIGVLENSKNEQPNP